MRPSSRDGNRILLVVMRCSLQWAARLRSPTASATILVGERDVVMGVLIMMLRSLALAALTVASSGVAFAQSVYLYVAPGASVYVTPTPNGPYYNGAPAVYPGPYPGAYGAPAPVVAAPLPPSYPTEFLPEAYVERGRAYAPGYGAPLSAYGAVPGIMQRRVYVEEPARPPAPVPYRRSSRW